MKETPTPETPTPADPSAGAHQSHANSPDAAELRSLAALAAASLEILLTIAPPFPPRSRAADILDAAARALPRFRSLATPNPNPNPAPANP